MTILDLPLISARFGLLAPCCCHYAHILATQIGALTGAQLVWTPQVNQGLVRFLDPKPTATATEHDPFTDQVIAGILQTGEAFFGQDDLAGSTLYADLSL